EQQQRRRDGAAGQTGITQRHDPIIATLNLFAPSSDKAVPGPRSVRRSGPGLTGGRLSRASIRANVCLGPHFRGRRCSAERTCAVNELGLGLGDKTMSLPAETRPRRHLAVIVPIVVVVLGLMMASCGINNIPTYEETSKAKWAEVENQYQ